MSDLPKRIAGKPILYADENETTSLIKFTKGPMRRFLSTDHCIIPLTNAETPKRPQELRGVWVENSEWIYGGIGFSGNPYTCSCWYQRFKLDYFARSIVPAPFLYEVHVVDSSGNLILKIGKYGNEDSKGKNSKEPLGGDEVGLFHAMFVATDTDHRIFIADYGNTRIISVKLKYAVDEILPLKFKK